MKKNKISLKEVISGLVVAVIIGLIAYFITKAFNSPLVDPLIVAMFLGIVISSFIGENRSLRSGFLLAPKIFIPIGVVFYGAVKLDFVKFAKVDFRYIALLLCVVLVYFATVLVLGKLLKQRKRITYLTATGSAICGASAITITSEAVDAEADEISISLLSVLIAAVFGLFIFFPFLQGLFHISDHTYALLSGTVLQFSGFVKAAAGGLSGEMLDLAVSTKAVRYLGLLIALPLFGSLSRKRFYLPWFVWAFLGAGIIFSYFPAIAAPLKSSFGVIQVVFWSIAMSAVGLNAKVQALMSNNGVKALLMSFVGFFSATIAFLIGIRIIG